MKYLPLNPDLWPVIPLMVNERSLRMKSNNLRPTNITKEDWKKLILAANVGFAAYFFVEAPQVSLAIVDSNF